MRPVFRPVSRNLCLSAALATGLGGLLAPLSPALALGSCTEGLAVITPDGQNATILPEAPNGDGKTCAVKLASGSETQVPVDLLMPDFGAGEEETEVAAVKGDAPLVTGYYSCGDDDALQLEILDGGKYADADGNEGRFARADDGKVTFIDGPLAKRAAHVDGGQLSVAPTKGAAPQPCEMVEE